MLFVDKMPYFDNIVAKVINQASKSLLGTILVSIFSMHVEIKQQAASKNMPILFKVILG